MFLEDSCFGAYVMICGCHAFMQTINDVLFGVISSGLSRYLDHRGSNGKNHLHDNECLLLHLDINQISMTTMTLN